MAHTRGGVHWALAASRRSPQARTRGAHGCDGWIAGGGIGAAARWGRAHAGGLYGDNREPQPPEMRQLPSRQRRSKRQSAKRR